MARKPAPANGAPSKRSRLAILRRMHARLVKSHGTSHEVQGVMFLCWAMRPATLWEILGDRLFRRAAIRWIEGRIRQAVLMTGGGTILAHSIEVSNYLHSTRNNLALPRRVYRKTAFAAAMRLGALEALTKEVEGEKE